MEKKIVIRDYAKRSTNQGETELKNVTEGIYYYVGDRGGTRFNIRFNDDGITIHKTGDNIDEGIVVSSSASNTVNLR
jgi:hypothetical protein